jgi:hypothetical protein
MKNTFTKILAVCFLVAGTSLVAKAQTQMGPQFSP